MAAKLSLTWLRHVALSSLAMAAIAFAIWMVDDRLPPPVQWSLLMAALGGTLGTIQFRRLVDVADWRRVALRAWLAATAWGTTFCSVAFVIGADGMQAGELLFSLALSGAFALLCWLPIPSLKAVDEPSA